ncbi:MAG: Cytochrome c family protein [uncultured Sulfurovum sp.]|uniref:Cytochrome c family protein n=1 Tax=uncultured Sulfurovum sp. TaxID=269237 RepID=A0A6S6U9D1_9BACT|nr:MAG: Cytochrome c family protein [uncultured Sulfurovum sp.]
MNKKLLTVIILAPLFYSACNSTNIAPKAENKQKDSIRVTQQLEKKVEPNLVSIENSNEITVSYVNNQKLIKNQGIMHISSFMETLQPTLMELIKSDSTFKTAMGACSSMGQGMTNDYNAISPDTKIRRTALKYRNEKNKPDDTDTVVMERFLASNSFKEPLVVEMPNHYRVYKALDMKQSCLACHGENISEDLGKILERNYPKDMATNFKIGEFRGVVVAEVKK